MKKIYQFNIYEENKYYTEIEAESREEANDILSESETDTWEFCKGSTDWDLVGEVEAKTN